MLTILFFIFSVESDALPQDEPTFIVFYSCLIMLFSLFCYNCKAEKPGVTMQKNGTMVTVNQHCSSCKSGFTWKSQPYLFGRYPAGNILLSFSTLMAGASISKVLLLFRHMNLCAYNIRTYFYHQSRFLFPAILEHWERYQSSLLSKIKNMDEIAFAGDGRFDSMGHSAKYGAYTMFTFPEMKIVHFELLQVCLIIKTFTGEYFSCWLLGMFFVKP